MRQGWINLPWSNAARLSTPHFLHFSAPTTEPRQPPQGARESGTARLEKAAAAYRAALEEQTRERVPLDWARTQINLGITLQTLGERESGTTRLEEAVAA